MDCNAEHAPLQNHFPGKQAQPVTLSRRGEPHPWRRKFTRALAMHKDTTPPLSGWPWRDCQPCGRPLITARRPALLGTSPASQSAVIVTPENGRYGLDECVTGDTQAIAVRGRACGAVRHHTAR